MLGLPLDAATRAFMETRFSRDFSRLRLYTDAKAIESARLVLFEEGQYQPRIDVGMRLLAHELAHIMRQRHILASKASIIAEDAMKPIFKSEADLAAGRVLKDAFDSPHISPHVTLIQLEIGPESRLSSGLDICEDICTDSERAYQSVAQSLGREGTGRTFADRLTPAENQSWERLSPECQADADQSTGEHSHRPRPRTAGCLSRLHGRIHAAIDIQVPRGMPVYAPIRGIVLQADAMTINVLTHDERTFPAEEFLNILQAERRGQ